MFVMGAMTTVHINAQLVWQARRTPSGNIVAACDDLGLTVQASTDDELHSMINEVLYNVFVDLLEEGQLERFLLDRGWRPNIPLPRAIPEDGIAFDVPFTVQQVSNRSAHA